MLLVQSYNGNGSNGETYRARFRQASDISMEGVSSQTSISPQVTQAINGGLKTISGVGNLAISTGDYNPSTGYIANEQNNISMMQVKLLASDAENLYLNSFTVKTNGTADDAAGISAVYLADDLNGNGVYDTGVDSLLTTARTFDSDNDTIKFPFSGNGKLLTAGNTYNWLVLYSLNDQNANNQTMYSSMELTSYITATGANSGQGLTISGAPIEGNTQTVSSTGAATLTLGPNNPNADDFGRNEINLVVMQFNINASAAEDLIFSSVTFTASGTLDEVNDITSAYVYYDGDNNGQLSIGVDDQLQATATYSGDNGDITFTGFNDTIYKGSSKNFLLVYNLSGSASGGENFSVKINDNNSITVKQPDNSDAIKLGAPIYSNTHAISSNGILTLSTGDNNPGAGYVVKDEQNVSMVQFNLAANTDESIRINSLSVTATGSFDARDDIANNGIMLYQDANRNGGLDIGTDVLLGTAPGFLGYDISLDGSSTNFAYTTSSGSDPIDNYTDKFTMEAWVYPTSASGNKIVINKENAYEIGINGSNLAVAIHTGSWAWDVSTPITFNTWHHVAATFDGTYVKLWMDGELKGSYNRTGTITKNGNPIKIGGRGTSTATSTAPLEGYIDEVRLSNVVRYSGTTYDVPETEFTNDDNTLGLWHINEGNGTTLADASASGSNMTLVDGTWQESTNSISSDRVKIDIPGGSAINAGSDEDWLILYNLSGNASDGETMAATIEASLINATGETSGASIAPQGQSAVNGSYKTVSDMGSLELTILGPTAKKESGKTNFTSFILDLKAGSAEDVDINSFTIHGKGTGNETTALDNVYIYQDVNKNSTVETGGPDTLIYATGKTYVTDNGTITWNFSNPVKITSSTTQRWIVYYDVNTGVTIPNGKTFQVSLELPSYIDAQGATSSSSIEPTLSGGLDFPRSAGIITISNKGTLAITEGDNNAGFTAEQTNGSDVLMLAIKMTTNSAEPVLVDSIAFNTIFGGSPTGTGGGINLAHLYKDANGNHEYDAGDTEIMNNTVEADGDCIFKPGTAIQIDSAHSEEWFVVFDFIATEGQTYAVKFNGSENISVTGLRTGENILPTTGVIQGGTKIIGNHVTKQDGNFNDTATWELGIVPGSLQEVEIKHDVDLTTSQTAGSIEITATGSLDLNGQTLSLDRGSLVNNGGVFTHANGTVRYNRTGNQTVGDLSYGNLIISGTGTKTLAGDIEIAGNLLIYSTLDVDNANNYNISLDGNWENINGTFNSHDGKVYFTGTGSHELGNSLSTETFNVLELAAGNNLDLTYSIAIKDTLVLNGGNVDATYNGQNTLYLGTSDTDDGVLVRGASDNYIVGTMAKWFSNTGTDDTLHVATASSETYRPVYLDFNTVTNSGYVSATAFDGDPGDNGLSLFEDTLSITDAYNDGYWSLSGNSFAFDNYAIELDANGFINHTIAAGTRVIARDGASSPWELNGTHVDAVGSVVKRAAVTKMPVQFGLADTCRAPADPGSISGPAGVDANTTHTYSVDPVAYADTTIWTLGADLSGSNYTKWSVDVSFPVGLEGTRDISVVAVNTCDTSENPSSLEVAVGNVPGTPDMPSGDTPLCQDPEDKTYTTNSVTRGDTYQWRINPSTAGTITGTDTSAILDLNAIFTGTLYIKVRGRSSTLTYGPWSDSLEVTVYANPLADAGTDGSTCYPNGYVLDGSGSGGGTGTLDYSWSPGANMDDSTRVDPTFTPASNPGTTSEVQTFTLTVTDDNSCSDTDNVDITIYRRPETGNTYHLPND